MRSAERVPAPGILDVHFHPIAPSLPEAVQGSAETGMADSAHAAVEQPKSLSGGVDVDIHANAGIADSVPEDLKQPKKIARRRGMPAG
jgi:hypothetical protein